MARLARRRSLVVGFMLGLVGVVPAVGDEASSPAPDTRVRVTAPGVLGKQVVGTLVHMDDMTLAVRPKGKDVLEVPRSAITRFEVSRGKSLRGKGAKIGAIVGLGAAVAIGLIAGEDCGSLPEPAPGILGLSERLHRNLCIDKAPMALFSSLLTVPAGALVGLGFAPGERWVRTTPDRVRLTVTPVRGTGIGAALSVRF